MLDTLATGKLIRDTQLKIGTSGHKYCQFLLSVHTGEPEHTVLSGVAFGEVAERIARLGKGDALAIVGSLKPTEWNDKTTGELKHGLSMTVSNSLSAYDIKKRRPAQAVPENSPIDGSRTRPPQTGGNHHQPFNDRIPF